MSSLGHTASERPQALARLASVAIVGLVVCLMVIDALTHSQPLVLPLLSAALTVVGFTWAAVITLRRRQQETPFPDRLMWPSLVVFFGLAAAMLSDADQLVKYLQFL